MCSVGMGVVSNNNRPLYAEYDVRELEESLVSFCLYMRSDIIKTKQMTGVLMSTFFQIKPTHW